MTTHAGSAHIAPQNHFIASPNDTKNNSTPSSGTKMTPRARIKAKSKVRTSKKKKMRRASGSGWGGHWEYARPKSRKIDPTCPYLSVLNKPECLCNMEQIEHMCSELSKLLPGYSFCYDYANEGGIEFKKYPGRKCSEEYKTVRFNTCRVNPKTYIHYLNERSTKGHLRFSLKVHNNAPLFTKREIQAFRICFQKVVPLGDDMKAYKCLPRLGYNDILN